MTTLLQAHSLLCITHCSYVECDPTRLFLLFLQLDRFGIPKTFESSRIHAAALVVGEYSEEYSHWEASRSLGEWLKEEGVPGITGIIWHELKI